METRWLNNARPAIAGWQAAGGISRGIILSSVVLTLLLVITISSVSLNAVYSTLRQNVENELDLDSRLLTQQLDSKLNSVAHSLSALASSSRRGSSFLEAFARCIRRRYG